MCCGNGQKSKQVNKYYQSDGQVTFDERSSHEVGVDLQKLPEHVDNIYLDRDLRRGILGFLYETKNEQIIVYSSLEAKTFCLLMRINPVKN